jgi:MFS family permease
VTVRRKLRVLGEPGYRRLWLGRTTSLIGDGMAPVAIAFAVLDLTGSASDLGIVLAAHSLVLIALILIGGVVADRISPRLAMLGADVVRTVAMGVIAALLLAGVAQIWELALLYAIDGAATAFFNPASSAIVPQLVPTRRLQEANTLLELSRSLGKVVGPALAGILLGLGSPGTALAVDAGTFAVSAVALLGLRAPRVAEAEDNSFVTDLRRGWTEFSSRTWLWAVVCGAAVANATYYPAIQVLGPTVARTSLNGSSSWAVIATAMGVGALVGGGVALWVRPRRPLLLSESLILLILVPVVLLALPASTAVIALGALLAGAVGSLAQILFETASVQHIPAAARSRVFAYDWFGSLALEPIGLALIGPLAASIGLSTTLWLCAALIALCLTAVISVPSVRRLEVDVAMEPTPTPPPRPVEAGD